MTEGGDKSVGPGGASRTSRWKWLAVAAGVLTLLIPLAGGLWCAFNWDRSRTLLECFLYRTQLPSTDPIMGGLGRIDEYLKDHWQGMTEDDVVALLGPPSFTIDLGYVEYCYPVEHGYSVLQPNPEDLVRGRYPPGYFYVGETAASWPKGLDVHIGRPEYAAMSYLQNASSRPGYFGSYVDILQWMEELDLPLDGSEHVIWYDYREPGDMGVGDESSNIFFFIRDGKVVQYHHLFP